MEARKLYNHHDDPGEHVNQAANPRYNRIKDRFKRYLPSVNALPSSMKDGGMDSHARKVAELQQDGIPNWLGKIPVATVDGAN